MGLCGWPPHPLETPDLYEIYLELYPAKVMAEEDELDEILAEAKTFIDVPRRDRAAR